MLTVLAVAAFERMLKGYMQLDSAYFDYALAPLHGKQLRVRVASPPLSILVTIDQGVLRLEPEHMPRPRAIEDIFNPNATAQSTDPKPVDAELAFDTAASALVLLSKPLSAGGNVAVGGDMSLVMQLVEIIKGASPDIGAWLQPMLGDSAAATGHSVARQLLGQFKNLGSTARWHGKEWLQEDNTLLAKRWQFELFKKRIQKLDLGLDRLEQPTAEPTSNTLFPDRSVEPFAPREQP